jgi:hypothetical protein
MTPRGWCALIVLAVPLLIVAADRWYMSYISSPSAGDLATVSEISRLALPDEATLLHSSAQRFPWESAYAHLRMSERQFEHFRSAIDFKFTRDREMVQATRGQMRWYHGDRPEWWRPQALNDPLAACVSRPARADEGGLVALDRDPG